MVDEGGGVADGGDLGGGVGGEIEFVVDEREAGGGGGETEKAGVGPGAEGDDLLSLRGASGEEEVD